MFLGILVAVNYLGTRQNKRWDLTAQPGLQPVGSDDQDPEGAQGTGEGHRVRAERSLRTSTRIGWRNISTRRTKLTTEFIDPDREPTRAAAAKIETLPTILFEYKGRTERVTTIERAGPDQRADQGGDRDRRKVYFTQGHGEKDTARRVHVPLPPTCF